MAEAQTTSCEMQMDRFTSAYFCSYMAAYLSVIHLVERLAKEMIIYISYIIYSWKANELLYSFSLVYSANDIEFIFSYHLLYINWRYLCYLTFAFFLNSILITFHLTIIIIIYLPYWRNDYYLRLFLTYTYTN
jgi:hypothetical protein